MKFVPIDAALLSLVRSGEAAFRAAHGAGFGGAGETIAGVVESTLGMPNAPPAGSPWGGRLMIDEEAGVAVGTCAFKGPPDAKGEVEIAYFVFPPHEGAGRGRAAAAELARIASASEAVRRIVAHTLPEENASVRILRGLGFVRAGEAEDPEAGTVWRWEREVEGRGAAETR